MVSFYLSASFATPSLRMVYLLPSGNVNDCSKTTPRASAICLISSMLKVSRCNFLYKFCLDCPILLASSAIVIFCSLHNCFTNSHVFMTTPPHSYCKPFGFFFQQNKEDISVLPTLKSYLNMYSN